MEKTLEALQKEDVGERALTILQSISYFGSDDIRTGTFASLFKNKKDLKSAIDALKRHKFVECFGKETVIRINPSKQAGIRMHLKEQKGEEVALCRAVKLLTLNMDLVNTTDHAMSVFKYSKQYVDNVQLAEKSAIMGGQVILSLMKMRRYQEGRVFVFDVFQFTQRVLGGEHPESLKIQQLTVTVVVYYEDFVHNTLPLLFSLPETYKYFFYLSEITVTLFRMSKSMYDSSPIETSPNFKKLSKRLPLYYTSNKLLETPFQVLVSEMSNMNFIDRAPQMLVKVYLILQEIGKARGETFEAKFRDVWYVVMSGMVLTFLKKGESNTALEILQTVYHTILAKLEEKHPYTLIAKRNIARILFEKGDFDEALILYNDITKKFDQVLGELHPFSLTTRGDLAAIDAIQGKLDDAYNMLINVYQMLITDLGESHDETLRVKHNLGLVLVLKKQRKNDDALKLFREGLEGYRKILGPNHPKTLKVMTDIDSLTFEDTIAETIHSHSKYGSYKEVASLIERGEDVNSQDSEGKSPLHYATEYNHVELVMLLLHKGAAYDVKNNDIKTPLQLAKSEEIKEILGSVKTFFANVKAGNLELIRESHSATKWIVNAKNSTGHTPLHWAAFKGHQHIILLLLELVADATSVSNKGNSPLHIAVSKGYGEMVQALLKFVGSDKMFDFINGQTKEGEISPLHVAAERGFVDIVKTLLKSGAVYDIRNRVGKTPLELAEDRDVRNLLQLVDSLFTDARKGNVDIVEKLKDVDSDDLLVIKHARDNQKFTVLETAVKKHQEVLENLQEILKSDFQNQ